MKTLKALATWNEIDPADLVVSTAKIRRPMLKVNLGLKAVLYLLVGVLSVGFASSYSLMGDHYKVFADFESVGGVRQGADIELAGVKVGTVSRVSLTKDDLARVEMKIHEDISISADAIITVTSRGVLGDKFIRILQGGSPSSVEPMGILTETESDLDLNDLIGQALVGRI